METLGEKVQEIFRLFLFEEKTHQQIAGLMELTKQEVEEIIGKVLHHWIFEVIDPHRQRFFTPDETAELSSNLIQDIMDNHQKQKKISIN